HLPPVLVGQAQQRTARRRTQRPLPVICRLTCAATLRWQPVCRLVEGGHRQVDHRLRPGLQTQIPARHWHEERRRRSKLVFAGKNCGDDVAPVVVGQRGRHHRGIGGQQLDQRAHLWRAVAVAHHTGDRRIGRRSSAVPCPSEHQHRQYQTCYSSSHRALRLLTRVEGFSQNPKLPNITNIILGYLRRAGHHCPVLRDPALTTGKTERSSGPEKNGRLLHNVEWRALRDLLLRNAVIHLNHNLILAGSKTRQWHRLLQGQLVRIRVQLRCRLRRVQNLFVRRQIENLVLDLRVVLFIVADSQIVDLHPEIKVLPLVEGHWGRDRGWHTRYHVRVADDKVPRAHILGRHTVHLARQNQ